PLVKEYPNLTSFREELARCQNNRAMLLSRTERKAEAEKAYGAARTLWQNLAETFPRMSTYRQELASCHANIAQVQRDTKQVDQAVESYREALVLREALVRDSPKVSAYRHELALTCAAIRLLIVDKEPVEAERLIRQELALRIDLAHEA